MMKVAIFGRTVQKESFGRLLFFLNQMLRGNNVSGVVYQEFLEHLYSLRNQYPDYNCRQIISLLEPLPRFTSHADLPSDTDLFLSLGGDGTFLSALPLVRDKNIPVAGVNFGRLGFLTTAKVFDDEAPAGGSNEWISALLEHRFTTEDRALLKAEYKGVSGKKTNFPDEFYPYALNEFSIQRDGPAVLEMDIRINGTAIPHYMADGVLVASATGSTAYSLSAGGPVVMPASKVLLIVPVAPHNLNIRPLVVPDTSVIEVSFTTRYNNAALSADNRTIKIPSGASVTITKAASPLKLVWIENDFVRALNQKLYWGADWRNN